MAWADIIADPAAEIVFFVRIEGDPEWVFTKVPDWAPDAGVSHVSGMEIPGAIAQSLAPNEARADVQNLKLSFVDLPESGTGEPYRFTSKFGATSAALADNGTFLSALAVDLDPVDLTVDLTSAVGMPALPFNAYIGNECVTFAAGAGPYVIARRTFPCDAGTNWGWRHRINPDSPGNYIVSTLPYSWFNRLVTMWATWIDSNGAWGAKADAQRLWTGRIKAVAMADDRWTLDCAPITADLDREVFFADPPTTECRSFGIELRGLLPEDRRVTFRFEGIGLGGPWDHSYTVDVAEAFYNSIDVLALDLFGQVRTQQIAAGFYGDGAGLDGSFDRGHVRQDDNLPYYALTWNIDRQGGAAGADAVACRIDMAPLIAEAFGYGVNSRGRGLLSFTLNPVTTFEAGPLVAAYPVTQFFWHKKNTYLRTRGTIPARFTAGPMGDGSNAAFEFAGRVVRRYSGYAGRDFTLAPIGVEGSNEGDHLGDDKIIVRFGDEDRDLTIRQVYLMPRSYGVSVAGANDQRVQAHFLRLLTSIGSGIGTNGIYDVYPVDYGLGLPDEFVDVASFDLLALRVGWAMDRQWCLKGATPLSDIGDPEAQTLGFGFIMNGSGQIAAKLGRDGFPGGVVLDEGNKAGKPGDPQRSAVSTPAAGVFNSGSLSYGYPIVGEEGDAAVTVDLTVIEAASTHGEQRGFDIEHRGLADWQGASSGQVAAIVDGLYSRLGRYAAPRTQIDRTIGRDLFTRIRPGDVVSVTDRAAPDSDTGLRGFTERAFGVLSVEEDWKTRVGRVRLMRDSVRPSSMETPVCPSADVQTAIIDGAGPNWILTLAANAFSDAGAGEVDRDYFAAGDVVLIVEGSAQNPDIVPPAPGCPVAVYRTIVSIDVPANQITINGNVGGLVPAGGGGTDVVYMTFSHHATDGANPCTAAQTPRGTWMAGTDGRINNVDVGHRYDS